MRGIIGVGGHVPHHRLDRSEVAAFFGKGGGRGQRAVASHDEDTTTMGAAAARRALASAPGVSPASLWFSTSTPAYLEKTNATTIHASLRLGPSVDARSISAVPCVRVQVPCERRSQLAVRHSSWPQISGTGLATSSDEVAGGDGAAAILVGDAADGSVIAEYLGCGIATDEFLERWRVPGAARSRS